MQLTRELPEADDLRLATGRGDEERWAFAERLPWDSTFFGYGVARLNAVVAPLGGGCSRADGEPERVSIEAVVDAAAGAGVRHLFATAETTDLPLMRGLASAGFRLVETRAHYHRPLAPVEQRYACRRAALADVPSLQRAARENVNAFDRFHADPAIAPADADRMMEAWVQASVEAGFADETIVPDVTAPEAFCTGRYLRQHWDGWGLKLSQHVLSAVGPRHRGWHVRLLSELGECLREGGAEHIFFVTQLSNAAVHRSCTKLGYSLGKGEHVWSRVV